MNRKKKTSSVSYLVGTPVATDSTAPRLGAAGQCYLFSHDCFKTQLINNQFHTIDQILNDQLIISLHIPDRKYLFPLTKVTPGPDKFREIRQVNSGTGRGEMSYEKK